ncbi:hypothetical protein K1719_034120 [Acacia pycnantha]|nr:hypothetical protein K1719_034120 [Acacia pycnantha]
MAESGDVRDRYFRGVRDASDSQDAETPSGAKNRANASNVLAGLFKCFRDASVSMGSYSYAPISNYHVASPFLEELLTAPLAIAKTVSLDAAKVIIVTPRYARLRAGVNGSAKGEIIGWENIELISDRPLETMLKEFKQLKEEYPNRILIASIMEGYNKSSWQELIDRVEQTGVDAIELNFSCPHGMPESS